MPAQQARIFLAMALCGAAVACAYDASLVLRRLLGLGSVLCGALDLLMGALAAAAMIVTALCLRTDPLRLYAYAGVAAGFALFRASAGHLVRRADALMRSRRSRRKERAHDAQPASPPQKSSKKMRKEAKACRNLAD